MYGDYGNCKPWISLTICCCMLLGSQQYTVSFGEKEPSMSLLSQAIPVVQGAYIFISLIVQRESRCRDVSAQSPVLIRHVSSLFVFYLCSIADEFYALFYLGLYCEARGETSKAASYMQQAATTEYATGVGRGDYMTTCARMHCTLRGWSTN